ncbi:hypothetical protein [Shinella sp.]|uniref:hypothetical protein n=1 Tax=Shinella sp. TaxID=1870904 RepID=UPI003F719AFF
MNADWWLNGGRVEDNEPGFDGTRVSRVKVKASGSRDIRQSVRSLPGTFEWRYGRGGAGQALYEAGTHYARLWETAGLASASSPDLGGHIGAGWKGVPDKRLDATDELNAAFPVLGMATSARLTDYCASGLTSDQIGKKHNIDKRAVPAVLEQDLVACAKHFRFT